MKCVGDSEWSTRTGHAKFFIGVQHKCTLKFCVKHCLCVKQNILTLWELELMFEDSVLFELV
jgi:hypothetical protein